MRPEFVDSLRCPYCGGAMHVSSPLEQQGDDIRYGLVSCRCFDFPIVEGILLLSLAKGYGGPEEELQPYVPLQAAAIQLLGEGRVDALRQWIRRHIPLAAPFLAGDPGTLLERYAAIAERLKPAVERFLDESGRFEFIGRPGGPARRVARRLKQGVRPAAATSPLLDFYPSRFFSPYSHSVALQLAHLPLAGEVLSLCCGYGMFENILEADGRAARVVSIDGQFLNLLIARHYAAVAGESICHDLQLGLPFADGRFAAVFSSTCLPEVPAQRLFTREAIRVTAREGWTWFDGIWGSDVGGKRVMKDRFYRFAQNFFGDLADYYPFFRECAGVREVAMGVLSPPQAYRSTPPFVRGAAEIGRLLAAREEPQIGAFVFDPRSFPGHVEPSPHWLTPERLSISPAYDIAPGGAGLELRRRPGFDALPSMFAPRGFSGYPASVKLPAGALGEQEVLLDGFCAGYFSLLPKQFDSRTSPLRPPHQHRNNRGTASRRSERLP